MGEILPSRSPFSVFILPECSVKIHSSLEEMHGSQNVGIFKLLSTLYFANRPQVPRPLAASGFARESHRPRRRGADPLRRGRRCVRPPSEITGFSRRGRLSLNLRVAPIAIFSFSVPGKSFNADCIPESFDRRRQGRTQFLTRKVGSICLSWEVLAFCRVGRRTAYHAWLRYGHGERSRSQ